MKHELSSKPETAAADAPDKAALHKELRRIFHHLHNVNNQRSDRMSMAHGLEARVPFLAPAVIDAIMKVDPEFKMITEERKFEKNSLRALFDGEIPSSVLWRTKAMQCEGIGMDWVSKLQKMCNEAVSDDDFANAAQRCVVTSYPSCHGPSTYFRAVAPFLQSSLAMGFGYFQGWRPDLLRGP
jgi:asparagine synthetase B (glutamine-hydrolysing)